MYTTGCDQQRSEMNPLTASALMDISMSCDNILAPWWKCSLSRYFCSKWCQWIFATSACQSHSVAVDQTEVQKMCNEMIGSDDSDDDGVEAALNL